MSRGRGSVARRTWVLGERPGGRGRGWWGWGAPVAYYTTTNTHSDTNTNTHTTTHTTHANTHTHTPQHTYTHAHTHTHTISPQTSPGDGYALLLPSAELEAALPHHGGVAVRHGHDGVVDARRTGGGLHLSGGGGRAACVCVFVHVRAGWHVRAGLQERLHMLAHARLPLSRHGRASARHAPLPPPQTHARPRLQTCSRVAARSP